MNGKKIDKKIIKIHEKRIKSINEVKTEVMDMNVNYNIDLEHFLFILEQRDRINTQMLNKEITLDKRKYLEMLNNESDLDFFLNIKEDLKDLEPSNGSEYYERFDYNIGIIADEFLYNSFKDIANFTFLTPQNYKVNTTFDFIIIVSTWRGLDGEWAGLGNVNSSNRKVIKGVINYYQSLGTPTVFYSKEDPTNYDKFVDIAKLTDIIFTTAEEKVEDYKRDCLNENVYVLKFGVNPIYNNPINIKHKNTIDGAVFAGSWYKKYPIRQEETKYLFDGVLRARKRLKIFDRNFHKADPSYFFPETYIPNISPGIDHENLQKVIKMFRWSLNLNSVKYSHTMFANRVIELQAMGRLVISNYSLGVNELFPNVFISFSANEVPYIMNNLSDKELFKHQLHGVRKVLDSHTTYHRISKMASIVLKDAKTINLEPKKVAVIIENKSKRNIENFNRQLYPQKILVTKQELHEINDISYYTFFDEKLTYTEYYLEDMINAFKYTDSDFVTNSKDQNIMHNYVTEWSNPHVTMFSNKRIPLKLYWDYSYEERKGYCIDGTEVGNDHNFDVYDLNFEDKKFSVIVPVYNNGDFLYSKCFLSLRRQTMFKNMEIILVDDGSTDNYTNYIVERLSRQYKNVKAYLFNDGGSGSASRPRNKAIELVTTPYITYLDPDNEAINDGYTKLYDLISEDKVDLAIGNMIRVSDDERVVNYTLTAQRILNKTRKINVSNIKDYLVESKFRSQSNQALMVKTSVIRDNKLTMPIGAIGQDTTFFLELLLHSRNFSVVRENIHVYYAGVTSSTVNNISLKTFKKYFLMEKYRIEFLKKHNLLDEYIHVKLNQYVEDWYFRKINLVSEAELDEVKKILYSIIQLYMPYAKISDFSSKIQMFINENKVSN